MEKKKRENLLVALLYPLVSFSLSLFFFNSLIRRLNFRGNVKKKYRPFQNYQEYLLIIFFRSILKIIAKQISPKLPKFRQILPQIIGLTSYNRGSISLLFSSDHRIPLISINDLEKSRRIYSVQLSEFPRNLYASPPPPPPPP